MRLKVKRTLQLEGVSSLNSAVERAKAIKVIQGESSDRKKENYYFGKRKNEEEEKASCKSDKIENREGRDYKGKGSVSKKRKSKEEVSSVRVLAVREEHFCSECSENKRNSD